MQIRAIMPFKVIQGHRSWYQSKPIYDFLLVINTDLHHISHRFQDIADYATGHMFAINMEVSVGHMSLTHSFRVYP